MIKRISPFFSLGSSRPNFTLFHPHPRKIRRGVIEMSGPGSGVHITSQSLIYFWRGAAVLVAYNRCGMYSRFSQPWGQFCRHKFSDLGERPVQNLDRRQASYLRSQHVFQIVDMLLRFETIAP